MKIFKIILLIAAVFVTAYAQAGKTGVNVELLNASADMSPEEVEEMIASLKESIDSLEDDADVNPIAFAGLCHIIGTLYHEMGDINLSEYYFAKGLERLGNDYLDSKEYRMLVSDIGQIFSISGSYSNALQWLGKARILYEKNHDTGADYARVLNNCALAFIGMGNDFWAKAYIDMAVDVVENSTAYRAADKAKVYSNMSTVYESMGYIDEALQMSEKAIGICDSENLGDKSKSQILNNIGVLFLRRNEIAEALECFKKSYDSVDMRSSLRSQIGFNLVLAQLIAGDKGLNETVRKMSAGMVQDVIGKFAFMNASQRQGYWTANLSLILGLNHVALHSHSDDLNDVIYDNALFSKALLLRATNRVGATLANSGDETSRQILVELGYIRDRLADEGMSPDSTEYYRLRAFSLEKDLMNRNISYAGLMESLTHDWREVRETLGDGEAAVEFIQVPEVENLKFTGGMGYAALVVRPGYAAPRLVPLCSDTLLTGLLDNVNEYDNEGYRQYLYGSGRCKIRQGLREIEVDCAGDSLYKLIWKPLEPSLDNVNRIYYSPIGTFNSISFSALNDGKKCLGESFDLRLLSSTAKIIDNERMKDVIPKNAVVYGGILYDADPAVMAEESRAYVLKERGARFLFPDERDERRGWRFLKGSGDEAQAISRKLDSISIPNRLLTSTAANEESLKSMDGDSPSLLHIATHGFYVSDSSVIERTPFLRNKASNVAMNRSGLLFSGANRAWLGDEPVEGIEDGILTSEEISRLDLGNTELAVLSACETGLGLNGSTEGVFGLQRGFKLAGVRTIVMSLWRVSDEETSRLMQLFYDNWLGGMERHLAFAEAQRMIRQENSNPYYWAGFVMLD